MTIDDKITDGKLQYNINKKAVGISTLSFRKIDKYEYLTGEKLLLSNQRQIIERAKFAYFPLGKTFEKQTKSIEDQGKKQIKTIEGHGKQLAESNDFIQKKDINIDRDSIPPDKQKKYLMNMLIKDILRLQI